MFDTNGLFLFPSNLLSSNILATTGIALYKDAKGRLTISNSVPAASGTNQLVQTNGVNVGSAGTVNWTTGVTGYIAGAVANLGVNVASSTATQFVTAAFGTLTDTNGLYLGAPGVTARAYRYNIPSGAYAQWFASGSGAIQWGTNNDQHFFAGTIVDPDLDNTTVLGQSNRRWLNAWIADYLNISNALFSGFLSVTNIPGNRLGYVELRSTNANSYTKFSRVSDDWKPTNYFKFSITNPLAGQLLGFNSVSYSAGEAGIILTNFTDDWLLYPTNVWNNRQGGSSVLTNLIGTGVLTNIVNGSSNWPAGQVGLLGPTNNGDVRIKSLSQGANITLSDQGTNIQIAVNGVVTSITTNANQFGPSVPITLKDGMIVTNAINVGVLNVTNPPGAQAKLRIWQTNGQSYTEFTVPNQWNPTNSIVLSITNPVVGQVFKVNSVSSSGGVTSIVLTNDADLGQGASATLTNLSATGAITNLNDNQFSDEATIASIKSGALLTNLSVYGATAQGTNLILFQNIGKAASAIAYLDSNNAPLFSINSNGFLIQTQSVTAFNGPTPTNTLAQGVFDYAGRLMPTWYGQMGLFDSPQPALFNNRVYLFSTSSGTTINTIGVASTSVGGTTVSHPTPDNLQLYMVDLATAASSNATASVFSSVNLATAGPQAGNVKNCGYFFTAEWSDTNNISGIVGGGANRTFVGLTATASPDLTNIVNTTNSTGQYAGLMMDSKQSLNMFITVRDAAAEFRTNTGINFVATNLYQFYLFQAPTSRFLNWKLRDLTANLSANGWFSNNVPTNFMKFGILTKNGTNRAHSVRFSKLYLEAPINPQ